MARGRPVKSAKAIDSVVSDALAAIHAVADKHTTPTGKPIRPTRAAARASKRPAVVPRSENTPAKPAIHHLIAGGPSRPPDAEPRVRTAADTRAALMIARREAAKGFGVPLHPGDAAYTAQHPATPHFHDTLNFLDALAGGIPSNAIEGVTHPVRHWQKIEAANSPKVEFDAQGKPLPLKPVLGIVPWGVTGKASAGAKAVRDLFRKDTPAATAVERKAPPATGKNPHEVQQIPEHLAKDPRFYSHKGSGRQVTHWGNVQMNRWRAEQARAAGAKAPFGQAGPKAGPNVHTLVPTEEAAPALSPQERVAAALPGAKAVRGKQEAGYSAARGPRFGAAGAAMRANPGIAGHYAARAAMRGELPKINFGGFKELDEHAIDELSKQIQAHPALSDGQKMSAVQSLVDAATEGKVPRNFEIKLLETVFGKDSAAPMVKDLTGWQKFSKVGADVVNIPRTLEATFDLSAPLRQGLVAFGRHPVITGKNLGPMMKAWRSEKYMTERQAEIENHPDFLKALEAKLDVADSHEEQFQSDIAGRAFGRRYLAKVGGGPIRMSDRAFSIFLRKTRMDIFSHLLRIAEHDGTNVDHPEFLKQLGRYVNSMTGRGDIGHAGDAAKWINGAFFSPRLWKSRFDFLNPVWYKRLGVDMEGPGGAFVRKQAIRAALQTVGGVSSVLTLSALAGAKVAQDPRSADFGKIRLGNTRLDIAGGFQQNLRLLAQIGSGTTISSTTGAKSSLYSGAYGKANALDVISKFVQGKSSPPMGVMLDLLRGQTFQGDPLTVKGEAYDKLMPLVLQDMRDIYKEHHGGMNGIEYAMMGFPVAAVGVGAQTYGPKKSNAASGYEKKLEQVGKPLTPGLKQLFALTDERAQAQAKYPHTVHGRFQGDLDVRVKHGDITPTQRAQYLSVARTLNEYQLSQELSKEGYGSTKIGGTNSFFDPQGDLGALSRAASEKKAQAQKAPDGS